MREQACFHFQQAAEKALKAALVVHGVDFPRTHDLAQLIALLIANRTAIPKNVRQAETLSPYAVQTRYPADLAEISDDEFSQAAAAARAVVGWAKTKIASTRSRKTAATAPKSRKGSTE